MDVIVGTGVLDGPYKIVRCLMVTCPINVLSAYRFTIVWFEFYFVEEFLENLKICP